MKARIDTTDDGMVRCNFPMEGEGASGACMVLTWAQAERLAHALLLQAYVARGGTPGARQFRMVRDWVLR